MKGDTIAVKSTRYNAPRTIRDNEFYGDLAAWRTAHAADNAAQIERLRRNLRLAREEALTKRQRDLLQMHYEQGKSVSEIARELGVQKSTVSRTIARAKRQLYRCLRYGL